MHNHGSRVSAASTEANPPTVSLGGVVVVRLLRRRVARHVIGAGSEIGTTGDGIVPSSDSERLKVDTQSAKSVASCVSNSVAGNAYF